MPRKKRKNSKKKSALRKNSGEKENKKIKIDTELLGKVFKTRDESESDSDADNAIVQSTRFFPADDVPSSETVPVLRRIQGARQTINLEQSLPEQNQGETSGDEKPIDYRGISERDYIEIVRQKDIPDYISLREISSPEPRIARPRVLTPSRARQVRELRFFPEQHFTARTELDELQQQETHQERYVTDIKNIGIEREEEFQEKRKYKARIR